jgi:hypothetical protein
LPQATQKNVLSLLQNFGLMSGTGGAEETLIQVLSSLSELPEDHPVATKIVAILENQAEWVKSMPDSVTDSVGHLITSKDDDTGTAPSTTSPALEEPKANVVNVVESGPK